MPTTPWKVRITSGMYGKTEGDRDSWETPQPLFDRLDDEFHFTLDAAASDSNHKCRRYFTQEDDGLSQPWSGTVWCNPPYGKAIPSWLQKAIKEQARGVTSVFLVFARTDTRWFHELVLPYAEVRFLPGRVKFTHPAKPCNNPSFGSMILVYRGVNGKRYKRR